MSETLEEVQRPTMKLPPLEERSITYKGYEDPNTSLEISVEMKALEAVRAAIESRYKSLAFKLLIVQAGIKDSEE